MTARSQRRRLRSSYAPPRLIALSAAVLCAASCVRPARAQAAGKPEPGKAEHWVDFHADHVEVEPESGALGLSGKAVVRVDRFQLSSEALKLSRSARGVHAEGSGRLAFCACAQPVIAFGFQSADLAPPTDVLLGGATLRILGLPVLWSPYLWLRSIDRAGLMPPAIGYRTLEGVVLSTGFHYPHLTSIPGSGSLDVAVAGYSRGGGRLGVRLHDARGSSELVLDYLERFGVEVRSQQASSSAAGRWVAERADWLFGARAREASLELTTVANPLDRAQVGLVRARGSVFGLGVKALSLRGQSVQDAARFGPVAEFSHGAALGRSGQVALSAAFWSSAGAGGARLDGELRGESEVTTRSGPMALNLSSRQRLALASAVYSARTRVASELRARIGAPLLRRYSKWTHQLEPALDAALLLGMDARQGVAAAWESVPNNASQWALLANLDSALGLPNAAAWEARVAAGFTGTRERAVGVLLLRSRMDLALGALSLDARYLPTRQAFDTSLRFAIGSNESVRFAASLDAREGDTRLAYGAWREDFDVPRVSVLTQPGVSAGARLALPWGAGIFSDLGGVLDLSAERVLASFATLRFRHPCRCLSVGVSGATRIGRPGFDAAFDLSVFPR